MDALTQSSLPALRRVAEGSSGRLTWFEAMTGLAYRHFADQQAGPPAQVSSSGAGWAAAACSCPAAVPPFGNWQGGDTRERT